MISYTRIQGVVSFHSTFRDATQQLPRILEVVAVVLPKHFTFGASSAIHHELGLESGRVWAHQTDGNLQP